MNVTAKAIAWPTELPPCLIVEVPPGSSTTSAGSYDVAASCAITGTVPSRGGVHHQSSPTWALNEKRMVQWAELTHLSNVFAAIGSTTADLDKAISAVAAACEEIAPKRPPASGSERSFVGVSGDVLIGSRGRVQARSSASSAVPTGVPVGSRSPRSRRG